MSRHSANITFIAWAIIGPVFLMFLILNRSAYFDLVAAVVAAAPFFFRSTFPAEYPLDFNLMLLGLNHFVLILLWKRTLRKWSPQLIESASLTPNGLAELRKRTARTSKAWTLVLASAASALLVSVLDLRNSDGLFSLTLGHGLIISAACAAVLNHRDVAAEIDLAPVGVGLAVIAPVIWLSGFFVASVVPFLFQFLISGFSVLLLFLAFFVRPAEDDDEASSGPSLLR